MNRHYFFWVIGITIASVALIFYSMWKTAIPPSPPPLMMSYPVPPFKSSISALGIVEASSDNISIGVPINRIVEKVLAHVGQSIKKGDLLFALENQDLVAELSERKINYEIARAKLKKMENFPRKEDLDSAESSLKVSEIALEQATSQYEMVQALRDSRALSRQEIKKRKFDYEEALAQYQNELSRFNKIKSGTWKPDLEITALEAKQAQASVERIEAEINRTLIRSPIDGKVLQVNIHEGESPASLKNLMIVGNTEEVFLKVSINQYDAPYFRPKAPAVAFLRGNSQMEFALEFVRLLPYLVNKQNVTSEITDKSDTKVLQVIYRIKNEDHNVFVGQQMDVFIEAKFP